MTTFLRAREVANGDDATLDVYNANLEYRSTAAALQVRAGRQILTEGTNFILMDGAFVRAKPLEGIDLVAYGGYQDADLQPYPEKPERSFGVFGAKLRATRFFGALMSLGYEGVTPDGVSPRHFLNFDFRRAVPYTDFADVYSRLELDVAEAEPAFFNAGLGLSVARPLYVNLEYDSYEPDPDRDRFLQDRIFDVFSVSRLQEARIGLTYHVARYLDVSTSYSFATYDKLSGDTTNGNIWKLGFSWNAFSAARAAGVQRRLSDRWRRPRPRRRRQLRRLRGDPPWTRDPRRLCLRKFPQHLREGRERLQLHRRDAVHAGPERLRCWPRWSTTINPDFETDVRGNFGITYSFGRS